MYQKQDLQIQRISLDFTFLDLNGETHMLNYKTWYQQQLNRTWVAA